MLLQSKNAVIYGGGGSIGGAVARAFAREGARVFLAGRTEMAVADFTAPVETAARTTFLTARAVARHMIPRRTGVILAFGGPGDRSGPLRDYYLGGTQVAFETIRRQLAVELGPHGIRVVTLASGGVPESLPEGFEGRERIVEMIEGQTLLGRAATLED
nr:SDR family oxidoreductase [Actinomycetota bacterium]